MTTVPVTDARLLACVPALVTCLSRYLISHAEHVTSQGCACRTCTETRVALALIEEARS